MRVLFDHSPVFFGNTCSVSAGRGQPFVYTKVTPEEPKNLSYFTDIPKNNVLRARNAAKLKCGKGQKNHLYNLPGTVLRRVASFGEVPWLYGAVIGRGRETRFSVSFFFFF